jgi:hypothetical protein
MFIRSLRLLLVTCVLLTSVALPVHAYVPYDSQVFFFEAVTKDILKLLPRAMGQYIYQNRYDFLRGMTFMTRDIQYSPLKLKDLEEIRREAYERLMRDIPYCVDAFKGGELKLDTAPANLAGRLGMIARSIILVKMPDFPDLIYLEKFAMAMEEAITYSLIDVWVFYDGYPEFNSCGELMERLKPQDMPTFRHARNEQYVSQMKEEIYAQFRAPEKFDKHMLVTDIDMNSVYSNQINSILDAFVFIWKCSGMDMAHASYAAPPGTVIARPKRMSVARSAGALSKPGRPVPTGYEEEEPALPGETEPSPPSLVTPPSE